MTKIEELNKLVNEAEMSSRNVSKLHKQALAKVTKEGNDYLIDLVKAINPKKGSQSDEDTLKDILGIDEDVRLNELQRQISYHDLSRGDTGELDPDDRAGTEAIRASEYDDNPEINTEDEAKYEIVGDIPDDFALINVDREVDELNDEHGTDYDMFFMDASDGETTHLYGAYGGVAFHNNNVTKVV